MSAARETVLQRVRAALADRPAAPGDVPVPAPAPLEGAAMLGRLVERIEDYKAVVTVTDDPQAAVEAVLARHGAERVVRAIDGDEERDPRALDAVDGVVTTCLLAIAETGTIVLDGGPGQGTRAQTLVPDLHVCVVRADQVVAGVAEALPRMAAAVREHGRPLTMVSGPSATSDIELERVEGVHGPRRLEVVLVR
jgi:L-lactate dehydrogenase complex protein LldG